MKRSPKLPRPKSRPRLGALLEGLKTLDRLWMRGLVPDDLEKHYFLTWFILCQGNILETARRLRIHRNTIQDHFFQYGYANKAVVLRHAWRRLAAAHPGRSFENLFHEFYQRQAKKPVLTRAEHTGLLHLWNAGFPRKVLPHHYLLWAVRHGKTREAISTRLSFSVRHQMRLFSQILNPRSRAGRWLEPLKPKPEEWYRPRYQARLRRAAARRAHRRRKK